MLISFLNFNYNYLDFFLMMPITELVEVFSFNKVNNVFIMGFFFSCMFWSMFFFFLFMFLDVFLSKMYGFNFSLLASYCICLVDMNEEFQDIDEFLYLFMLMTMLLLYFFYFFVSYCIFFKMNNFLLLIFSIFCIFSVMLVFSLFEGYGVNCLQAVSGSSSTSFVLFESFLDYVYIFIALVRSLLQNFSYVMIFIFFLDFYFYYMDWMFNFNSFLVEVFYFFFFYMIMVIHFSFVNFIQVLIFLLVYVFIFCVLYTSYNFHNYESYFLNLY